MKKYYFFYGNYPAEFERSQIPDSIFKRGIKIKIASTQTKISIQPSMTKVVILNV